ncbi:MULTISPECIES: LolA family protein [unclassified Arthrobacter]|uniref:LolA family protein n=1 Tax=unclassified Arthrobacter TaxID=235627 RepID=UPI0002F14CC7|nr:MULTISPECIES: hypothetical protein [unclassified Arthrobacter]
MNRKWRNWAPAVAVTAVMGAGVILVPLTANAAVDLPDLTAAEVLELAAGHSVDALSGTVEQTSDLGLPDLSLINGASGGGMGPSTAPGTDPGADGGSVPTAEGAMLEMLTAPHTARVFLDGPTQARIQIQDEMAERNLILNGDELWFYDSEENSAVHSVIKSADGVPADLPGVQTPDQLATLLLEKADPTTEVSVGPDRMVAGRAAYQLIMTPRSNETLVGSITVDVDAETGLPLAVSVAASSGTTPAFSAAYTEISFEAPAPEIFDFTPPAGATITEAPEHGEYREHDDKRDHSDGKPEATDESTEPTVTGTGWGTVVEFSAGDFPTGDPELTGMIDQLSTPVDGGRLMQTRLLNVLLTDDGRVLVGSVPADRLQAVADDE